MYLVCCESPLEQIPISPWLESGSKFEEQMTLMKTAELFYHS